MINNAEEKKAYSRRNATRLKEVMDELDKLSDNLQQRYKEKKESYEKRRSQFFEDSSNRSSPVHNFPGTSVRVVDEASSNQKVAIDDEDENELSYSIMECCELIKCIQSSSSNQINKVLIIDIRSAEDYAYSCIMANKLHTNGQVCCWMSLSEPEWLNNRFFQVNFVNIPEHIVAPALSFPALRKQLKLGLAMDAFERRRSMDKVVIMDWKSNHFDEHSKCVILANALWKVSFGWEEILVEFCSPFFLFSAQSVGRIARQNQIQALSTQGRLLRVCAHLSNVCDQSQCDQCH